MAVESSKIHPSSQEDGSTLEERQSSRSTSSARGNCCSCCCLVATVLAFALVLAFTTMVSITWTSWMPADDAAHTSRCPTCGELIRNASAALKSLVPSDPNDVPHWIGRAYHDVTVIDFCEGKYGGIFRGQVLHGDASTEGIFPEFGAVISAPVLACCGLVMLFGWHHHSDLVHLVAALFIANGIGAFGFHFTGLKGWGNVDGQTLRFAVWLVGILVLREVRENAEWAKSNSIYRSYRQWSVKQGAFRERGTSSGSDESPSGFLPLSDEEIKQREEKRAANFAKIQAVREGGNATNEEAQEAARMAALHQRARRGEVGAFDETSAIAQRYYEEGAESLPVELVFEIIFRWIIYLLQAGYVVVLVLGYWIGNEVTGLEGAMATLTFALPLVAVLFGAGAIVVVNGYFNGTKRMLYSELMLRTRLAREVNLKQEQVERVLKLWREGESRGLRCLGVGLAVAAFLGVGPWLLTEQLCGQIEFFRWFPGHLFWHTFMSIGLTHMLAYLVVARADNYNCVCAVHGGIPEWRWVRHITNRCFGSGESTSAKGQAARPVDLNADVVSGSQCSPARFRPGDFLRSVARLFLPTVTFVEYHLAAGIDGLTILTTALVMQADALVESLTNPAEPALREQAIHSFSLFRLDDERQLSVLAKMRRKLFNALMDKEEYVALAAAELLPNLTSREMFDYLRSQGSGGNGTSPLVEMEHVLDKMFNKLLWLPGHSFPSRRIVIKAIEDALKRIEATLTTSEGKAHIYRALNASLPDALNPSSAEVGSGVWEAALWDILRMGSDFVRSHSQEILPIFNLIDQENVLNSIIREYEGELTTPAGELRSHGHTHGAHGTLANADTIDNYFPQPVLTLLGSMMGKDLLHAQTMVPNAYPTVRVFLPWGGSGPMHTVSGEMTLENRCQHVGIDGRNYELPFEMRQQCPDALGIALKHNDVMKSLTLTWVNLDGVCVDSLSAGLETDPALITLYIEEKAYEVDVDNHFMRIGHDPQVINNLALTIRDKNTHLRELTLLGITRLSWESVAVLVASRLAKLKIGGSLELRGQLERAFQSISTVRGFGAALQATRLESLSIINCKLTQEDALCLARILAEGLAQNETLTYMNFSSVKQHRPARRLVHAHPDNPDLEDSLQGLQALKDALDSMKPLQGASRVLKPDVDRWSSVPRGDAGENKTATAAELGTVEPAAAKPGTVEPAAAEESRTEEPDE